MCTGRGDSPRTSTARAHGQCVLSFNPKICIVARHEQVTPWAVKCPRVGVLSVTPFRGQSYSLACRYSLITCRTDKKSETRRQTSGYSPFDCDSRQCVNGRADGNSLKVGNPAADRLATPPFCTTVFIVTHLSLLPTCNQLTLTAAGHYYRSSPSYR